MWGGRFRSGLHPLIRGFTGSLPFDRRLLRHDLVASLAHVRMLGDAGVLEGPEAREILAGLSSMLAEVEAGELEASGDDEDVHSWIERVLRERIGAAADRVHTARSRNDQTAVALRLFTREALEGTTAALLDLADELCERAGEHAESWMPGYTHLQRGQPVSLAHHLLAHGWALEADTRRLRSAHRTAGVSPLGAGALAGTPHPIDPERTARLLGFHATAPNSLAAVADRDWVAETTFACALTMIHLSRWAEETVLWSSAEFGFLELDDAVAQGSSLMPQKKNPEAAELVRGKSGRVVGSLVSLLVTLKGLPLAYDSDLQEDKEALFDALDTTTASLAAAATVLRGTTFRTDRMAEALSSGFVTATALADRLVERGVPFRRAHVRVGGLVRAAEESGCELRELPADVLAEHCPELDPEEVARLEPGAAAADHDVPGGPSPRRVREQRAALRDRLDEARAWLEEREPPPVLRSHREGTFRSGDRRP